MLYTENEAELPLRIAELFSLSKDEISELQDFTKRD